MNNWSKGGFLIELLDVTHCVGEQRDTLGIMPISKEYVLSSPSFGNGTMLNEKCL